MGTKVFSSYTCFNQCRLTLRIPGSPATPKANPLSWVTASRARCPGALGMACCCFGSVGLQLPHAQTQGNESLQHIITWRLTWNIIMEVWKIIFLPKWVICRFHINLPGCNHLKIPPHHGVTGRITIITWKQNMWNCIYPWNWISLPVSHAPHSPICWLLKPPLV